MIETRSLGRVELAGATAEVVSVQLTSDASSAGMAVEVLSLGAAIRSVEAPDAHGGRGPVHLSLPCWQEYADHRLNPHLGASIGRWANRIAGAAFELDGVRHDLVANDGANCLHGGPDGWDRHNWEVVDTAPHDGGGRVVLRHISADGDAGFPGRVEATATYELDGDRLRITYEATTDAPTVVNMTNHGYWNLAGTGTIEDHHLTLAADRVLPVDDAGIPTGEPIEVAGTPFDLRSRRRLGDAMAERGGGFDQCFVVRGEPGVLRPAAVLDEPSSGRWLRIDTDQPGVQLYTGNGLHDPFEVHGSVSLETQRFPDAPNRPELGPSALCPGETYRSVTELTAGTGDPPSI